MVCVIIKQNSFIAAGCFLAPHTTFSILTIISLLAIASLAFAADLPVTKGTASAKYAVQASAQVQEEPAQITLNWPEEPTAFSHTVYRRLLGEKQWNPRPIAVLGSNATGFTDQKVNVGVSYEYRIDRAGKDYLGRGYICAGIALPQVNERGTVILLVEESVAAPLASELALLEQDLYGDGWQVLRRDVARDAKVTQVKKLIEDEYHRDPDGVRTVFLFGHVPVPYSGCISADGHPDHRGAWPADLYYADMTGKWTDDQKHKYADQPLQINEPGDGKFDQSTVPANSLTLEVGRVDLSDLPQFQLNEVELLRQYLVKNHLFRQGFCAVEERGLINDNFGAFDGEAFASSSWMNFAAFFGAQHIDAADWLTVLPTNGYLWAHGNGGGSMVSAAGVGTTTDFARVPLQTVFTTIFGSYHGDWNRTDNFMRAALANSGWPLTCAWDGRPHWYFHHMALGKNIGYSALRTQNNNELMDYLSCNDAKQSRTGKNEDREYGANSIHVALLGDPTLRMQMVQPPRQCRASTLADGGVKLEWEPSTDTLISGYLVYSAPSVAGPFTILTAARITGKEFVAAGLKPGELLAIKSVKLQTSGGGTYWNASQAQFIRPLATGVAYRSPQLSSAALTTKESVPLAFTPRFTDEHDRDTAVAMAQSSLHGLLRRLPNGHFEYTSVPEWHGKESFKLIPRDGMNDGAPVEYTVEVEMVPAAPRPKSQSIAMAHKGPVHMQLSAHNPNDPEKVLTWQIASPPKFGKLSGTSPDLIYEPSGDPTQGDSFTFTASNGYLTSEPATVKIGPANDCASTATAKNIDGDLADWGELPINVADPELIRNHKGKPWVGPDDCRFSFGTAWDKNYLYIAIQVTKKDPVAAQKNKSPWDQDGIEIRLDARPVDVRSKNLGEGEMADFLLLALSPGDVPGEGWLWEETKGLPEGTKYACRRNTHGYDAEVAIPIAYLNRAAGAEWTGFRLNVAVDAGSADRQFQCWWKPDWRAPETYWGSGSFLRK